LDNLVELGIDALHGTKICLVGNIDASDTLPNGPLDGIRDEVEKTGAGCFPRDLFSA